MISHLLSVGSSYCLRLPDGRTLGHVTIERVDDVWAEGPFAPAPGFSEVRPLFDRADELARDQLIPLWEEAADAIEALDIHVIEDHKGARHTGLRVFVVGDEASIGMPLCVP